MKNIIWSLCAVMALVACERDGEQEAQVSGTETQHQQLGKKPPLVFPEDRLCSESRNVVTDGEPLLLSSKNATNVALESTSNSPETNISQPLIHVEHRNGDAVITISRDQIDSVMSEVSGTLQSLSADLEKDLNVDSVAQHVEKLAQQVGQSAKALESTTQSISAALQKGFAEGYHEAQPSRPEEHEHTH